MLNMLGPEDVKTIYCKLKNIKNTNETYISEILSRKNINEYFLRIHMFHNKYVFLSIGENRDAIIGLKQSDYEEAANYVIIEYLENILMIDKHWNITVELMKDLFPDKNKFIIMITETQSQNIQWFLEKNKFKFELELKNELGVGENILVYSALWGEPNEF